MALRRILFILAFLFICFGYAARQNKTFAVTCAPTGTSPDFTISGSCSFAASQMGVDAGTGTTNTANLIVTNGTLTVAVGTTIGVGKITIGASGIVSNVGITKLNAPLYWTDAEVPVGDGYAVDPAITAVSLTGGTGKKRRDALASTSVWDCDDTVYSTTNTCCTVGTYYQDADGDGYGDPAVSQSICPTAGWVANNTDCNDGASTGSTVWIAHAQCYANMDQDPVSAGLRANTTCLNTSSCATATKASASTNNATVTTYTAGQLSNTGSNDCNDNDSSVYPGNGSWYTDNSDHDCVGGVTNRYGTINCSTCDPGNGHSGRRDDNGGFDSSVTCGNSGSMYNSLGWGCYDSTTCPNQYSGSVQQQCH